MMKLLLLHRFLNPQNGPNEPPDPVVGWCTSVLPRFGSSQAVYAPQKGAQNGSRRHLVSSKNDPGPLGDPSVCFKPVSRSISAVLTRHMSHPETLAGEPSWEQKEVKSGPNKFSPNMPRDRLGCLSTFCVAV